MEDRKNVSKQGGQGQGNKPGQDGSQKPRQGGGQPGRREGQGGTSDKPSTRPTPSGVPNEGRRSEGQHGELGHGAQERQGGYKGGRQETGGVPNPDDADDDTSAGSFRRKDVNSQTRNPG